jgi:iron(III) transport system substrate-binding protein
MCWFFIGRFVPTAAGAESLQDIVREAQKEGQLNVTWGTSTLGGTKGLAAFQEMINKKYKVKIQIKATPGPSMSRMASRILQEQAAGRPSSSDLFVGADVHMPLVYKHNFFLPVNWVSVFPEIPSQAVELNGQIVRIYDGIQGFVYNTKLVPPNEAPRKFEDMFKPKWENRLATTNFATGLDRWTYIVGEERGVPAVKKFVDQYVKGLIRSTEFDKIANGQYPILAFSSSFGDAIELQEAGAPIDYSVVVDAPWMTTFYVGIPKNSAHPNAGKLLISLVLSKEGQDILWETSRDGSHHVKGTKYYSWFQKKYADTKFTEFNAETMIKLENQLGEIGKKYRDWLKGK